MIKRINQFLPAAAKGDGVTGSAKLFQRLLAESGYNGQIFAGIRPEELSDEILPLEGNETQVEACDLLLIHHSMGHDYTQMITETRCNKVMIFHNITPAEMFAEGSMEALYSKLGRQQLSEWKRHFIGAIGVSALNCRELKEQGYPHIVSIPALVDPARLGTALARTLPGVYPGQQPLLLAVGRIAENKRQHLMIQAMPYLIRMRDGKPSPRLIICGGTTSPDYLHYLQSLIQQHGLERSVTLAGKTSDAQLTWLYQKASVLWCTSAHEGFCMPLIEAASFDLPIIATASSNIPDTLGEAGLLLRDPEPRQLAATTAELLENSDLNGSLIRAGQRNLERYKLENLQQQLHNYLQALPVTEVESNEANDTQCNP